MLINKITKQWIDAYINHPKTAVIIESEDELSHFLVVEYLHDKLIGSKNNPYIFISSEDKKTIGVEKIRELKKQLSLQANASNDPISRMIVIDQADRMTDEAQNALLKLIEELPARTTICLTVTKSSQLLTTVTSRCFLVRVLPIEQDRAMQYAKNASMTDQEASRMYLLSSGNPGLFLSLINNESSPLVQAIQDAKIFLSSTVFDRQKLIMKIVKTPELIPLQLRAVRIIALTGLRSSVGPTKNRWKQTLEQVTITESQLASNVSAKLALLRLSIFI